MRKNKQMMFHDELLVDQVYLFDMKEHQMKGFVPVKQFKHLHDKNTDFPKSLEIPFYDLILQILMLQLNSVILIIHC